MEVHFQDNSKKYFNDPLFDIIEKGLTPESTEKIRVKLSIKNCQINTTYQIKIKSLDNSFSEFSTEEIVSKEVNSIIVFSSNFIFDYFFEEIQNIQISIIVKLNSQNNNEKMRFQRNTRISSIVCENGTYERKVSDDKAYSYFKEILVLAPEKFGSEQLYLNLFFKCKKTKNINYSNKSSKTRFLIKNNNKDIYLSEVVNDSGIFENILIPKELLSPLFSILFFNINRVLTNAIPINIKNLIDNSKKKNNSEFIQVPLLDKRNNIITIINNSNLVTKYSLFDFIQAGIRLNSFIAIDLSNKNLVSNIKEEINRFGNIISFYSCKNAKIPIFKVYGFGAKINNKDTEFFNLNLEKNPDIPKLTNVLKKYEEFSNKNIDNIKYINNNNFSPLIKHVSNEIKIKYEPLEYNILFILTSNICKDIKETVDSLIVGSPLPFSVVIIGIGEYKIFEKMKIFNNLPNESSKGIPKSRDIAHLISVNKNENSSCKILLRKIAKQIVEYYNLSCLNPEKIKKNNVQDIKESFNKYKSFNEIQYYNNKEEEEKNINEKKTLKNTIILPYGLNVVEEEQKENEEKDKKYDNTPTGSNIDFYPNPYSIESNDCDNFSMKHSIKIDEDNKIEKFINTPFDQSYPNSNINIKSNMDEKDDKFANTHSKNSSIFKSDNSHNHFV